MYSFIRKIISFVITCYWRRLLEPYPSRPPAGWKPLPRSSILLSCAPRSRIDFLWNILQYKRQSNRKKTSGVYSTRRYLTSLAFQPSKPPQGSAPKTDTGRKSVSKNIEHTLLPPHVVVLDDHDDDHGIRYGRDQEQRDVEANQHDTSGLGEFHLRRRELGDQPLDDRRLFQPGLIFRPQAAAITRRRVVEHFVCWQCVSGFR